MSLDATPLQFGKYKGQSPEDIADTDPGYIVWLYDNVMPKHCSKALKLACVDALEEEAPEEADFD